MNTYLVTGAAGFIGSNFVKYIIGKHGADVNIIVLDALTYAGNLASLDRELQRDNVRFVRGDIGDRELVSRLLAENDVPEVETN